MFLMFGARMVALTRVRSSPAFALQAPKLAKNVGSENLLPFLLLLVCSIEEICTNNLEVILLSPIPNAMSDLPVPPMRSVLGYCQMPRFALQQHKDVSMLTRLRWWRRW